MDNRRQLLAVEYLRVLDLDAGASVADVREAYRLQVRTWNPDNPAYNPTVRVAAERRLAEVRQAYEWLQSNGDAVVGQASVAGARSTHKGGASTMISKRVTNGFLYLALVGLLIYGITVIASRNEDAWHGPLVIMTTSPDLSEDSTRSDPP